MDWLSVKGFCLDISGVLKNSDGSGNDIPIEGSKEAISKLISNNIPFRLVTNESQVPSTILLKKLQKIGFNISAGCITSPPVAMCNILKNQSLRPFLVVHKDVLPDFDGLDIHDPNALVMGDAAEYFTYETLNKAFQFLISHKNPKFFTLGKGRFYKQGEKDLMLDVGPFTTGMEYATGLEAEIVGKPSAAFFNSALQCLGLPAENVVMIGDDIVSDVGGAQKAGMRGIQVRTGKFRPCDEPHSTVKPDLYVDNLKQAMDLFFASKQ